MSSTAVAREAGVTRGLLHHYFGDHRSLQREAVRSMLRYPSVADDDGDLSTAIGNWLTMVGRNRAAWLAALDANDPEIQAVVEAAREDAVDRLVARFGGDDALRGVLRPYSAFAEAATVEWLVRRRLTQPQVHDLLLTTLQNLTETRRTSS